MPLTPAINLSYAAGDDIDLGFLVTNEEGVVANISGHTPRFVIALDKDSPVISTETSPATATATVTVPLSGLFDVFVAGEETQELRGTFKWEAELEDVESQKATVARGYITFSADLV